MVVPQAYTNLSIFKRFEVWILLALTVAGLAFVVLSDKSEDRQMAPAPPSKPPTPSKGNPADFEKTGLIDLKSITVKRHQDEYLAEIGFAYDNQTEATIDTLDEAKLITATGKSIPVFFLAFAGAPPQLQPKMKSETSLLFSVLGEDIVGELTLSIGSQRTPVKSKRSFDPETIGDSQAKTFRSLDW